MRVPRLRKIRRSLLVAGAAIGTLLFASASPAHRLTTLVLEQPPDQTFPATSDCYQTFCGTLNVAWVVSDSDYPSDQVTVSCNGAMGMTYVWGMSYVTCQAQDPGGNKSAPVSFTVNVTVPPPTFPTPPGPVTFPGNGPAGGVATFAIPAAQDVGGQAVPVTCDHTSGITYPYGDTVVTCTAQIKRNDSQGNPIGGLPSATTQFTITITAATSGGGGGGGGTGSAPTTGGTPPATDTTPPTIAQHAGITVAAASKSGVVVRYAVTASDPGSTTAVTATCTPPSGSTFHLAAHAQTKRTIVTCDAQDAAGNQATPQTFAVTVLGVSDQLALLELAINRSGLAPREKVELTTLLATAGRAHKAGNEAKAAQALRSFVARATHLTATAAHVVWIVEGTRALRLID